MICSSCGAPLPANSLICAFCQTRNSLDLQGMGASLAQRDGKPRDCPSCNVPMTLLNVGLAQTFLIEQCPRCFGLFFDPNELQALLDDTVRGAYEVDYRLLTALSNDSVQTEDRQVTYKPCPDCKKLMNRVNFGERSGVIVDRCRDHGVWLDAGELRKLLEWKKAGGQLFDNERRVSAADAQKALDASSEYDPARNVFFRLGSILSRKV
jgi:Zn-finger nucleic acid-binding protein